MKKSTASLVCIGCGCTDARACPGGCSWTRPGVCSVCDGKDIFKPSRTVVEIIVSAIRRSTVRSKVRHRARRLLGYRRVVPSCSVPAIAMLALLGDEFLVSSDRRNLAEGMQLRPVTRIYLGFDGVWSFNLVWHRRDEHGTNYSETHRIRHYMGRQFKWGGR